MSDSDKEDQETCSDCVMKKKLRVYIQIECFTGNTVPIITANLHEVCCHDAVK